MDGFDEYFKHTDESFFTDDDTGFFFDFLKQRNSIHPVE
jgi:hypothetical protein